MPSWVADLVIAFLILLMTYVISSEGLWGAALVFFNVLFSGIIAFNFYEPLAKLLADNAPFLSGFSDTLCLMVIFIVSLTIFRLTTDSLAPAMVRFPLPIYHIGRLFFGAAATLVALAIMILAFETAPVHQKALGSITYKSRPPFTLGLDHHWLAFFQYTTGHIFADYGGRPDPYGEYGTAHVFDPKAEWLLNHQKARPYGNTPVLESEEGASAEEKSAAKKDAGAGAF